MLGRPGGGGALNRELAELIPNRARTEMQRMVLEHDWAATPLGPQAQWSATLRTAAYVVGLERISEAVDATGSVEQFRNVNSDVDWVGVD